MSSTEMPSMLLSTSDFLVVYIWCHKYHCYVFLFLFLLSWLLAKKDVFFWKGPGVRHSDVAFVVTPI